MSSVLASAVAIALTASELTQPAPAPAPAETAAPEQSAPAAASGSDVVHLRGGGFVRGTVEEYEPGGNVVLRKADGTTRTFGPDEVDRVEVGGTPAPAPEPEPAVSDMAARVFLVRGDRRRGELVLQRRTGGVYVSGYGGSASGVAWDNVCTAPCERPIDTNGAYTVNALNKGPALMSKSFSLDPYRGQDVTLEVRGGSTGMFIGGVLVSTVGGTLAAVSSLWFIDDARSNAAGGAMLAAGIGGFVGGIVMLFRARHRVRTIPGRP
ncbi:MAG: hypothetical protein AAGA54_11945 [Myxococcota bacterium]